MLPHLTWTFLKQDSRHVFVRCCLRGRNSNYNKEYVRAAGSPYAVAENWNGDPNGQLGQQRWIWIEFCPSSLPFCRPKPLRSWVWNTWNEGRYNWTVFETSQDRHWVEKGGNMEPNDLAVSSFRHFTPVPHGKTSSAWLWMWQASRLCSWMSGRHGRLWLSVSRGSRDVTQGHVVAVLMDLSQFLILDALLDAEHASHSWLSFQCVYYESFFVWLVLDYTFEKPF